MLKRLIVISLFFGAASAQAQSTECASGLKELMMGPVAMEVLNKNKNSPIQIKEIASAYSKKDKQVSYKKSIAGYQCNAFNRGDMGYIVFENSDIEIIMAAYGGAQALKGPKPCFKVGLVDKQSGKIESTNASLVVDKTFPIPEAVNECR